MHHVLKCYLHWHCAKVIVPVSMSYGIGLTPAGAAQDRSSIHMLKTDPELAKALVSDVILGRLLLPFIFYVGLRQ